MVYKRGIVSNMPERPSPVNDPATAQQILQPLQGSGGQVAPPTTSSSQASLTSGTTASGVNASQSSSQENATGSSVSNDPTVTLEVFSFNVLVLYSGRSLLVIFLLLLLNVTFPRLCFFCYAGAGFQFLRLEHMVGNLFRWARHVTVPFSVRR